MTENRNLGETDRMAELRRAASSGEYQRERRDSKRDREGMEGEGEEIEMAPPPSRLRQ